ncbi:MAG: peptidylprolyl isomerase [Holophagaceae bacterium]|nr:peptidylprolyl isomerase [Holophagaceae bacterium]
MYIRALLVSLTSIALFGQTAEVVLPKPRVQFTTNLGSFIVELEPEAAPKTVENFLEYSKSGFYKGTTFHRVIRTFMVQGGGHNVDGSEKKGRAPLVNEAKRSSEMGVTNTRGSIAMARLPNPDSATSQFFINVVDNARLNYPGTDGAGYCAFGYVIDGMDTIDKIRDVQTGAANKPLENVIIIDTKVTEVGGGAKDQATTTANSAVKKPTLPGKPELPKKPDEKAKTYTDVAPPKK